MPSALDAAPGSAASTLLAWYDAQARDLPWRRPAGAATPWRVLVSEVMLQQTPVARVVPVFEAWLARWPTPAALAAEAPGEAVRAWGRLGYPRRALRLHAAASACVERHGGRVPRTYDELRALPGVGDYTASAVAAFAFGQPYPVLDTNVRRVLARLLAGEEQPPPGAPSAGERRRAVEALPPGPGRAARWGAALMELGQVVCRSRTPDCEHCPLTATCRWRLLGRPASAQAARRSQRYEGTDRQARGRLLAVLRDADGPVAGVDLAAAWPPAQQRARALDGLVADGLVVPLDEDEFALPG
jgi:A/G-specific adenine glycosylase